LQSPIPGDAVDPGKIPDHRELACEGIPEAIEKGEQCLRSHDVLQASDQRGKEEPGHAAVQSVRHPAVVGFAEFIAEIRVGDRKAQPRQVLPIVTQYIAIMKRNDLTLPARQDIAKADRTAPPLARLTNIYSLGYEQLEELLNPRAVVPDQPYPLRQGSEKVLGQTEF